MKHRAPADFWQRYRGLPESVRNLADKNYELTNQAKIVTGRQLSIVLGTLGLLGGGLVLWALAPPAQDPSVPSVCYGTTADGALRHACRLPLSGSNYEAYSLVGVSLGRTYVHCSVAGVMEAAYRQLSTDRPEIRFVYGETGLSDGGPFKPHRTHQNGLSVDFMVPVLENGAPAVFPARASNKFGYNLEFDNSGSLGDLQIDFEALTAHLSALVSSAQEAGVGIWRVIFDPELQPFLRETSSWSEIAHVQFSTKRSWVRHDEHYHVDFELPCSPLGDLD